MPLTAMQSVRPSEAAVERRAHARIRTISRVAKLIAPLDTGLCRIKNISDTGLMVETCVQLAVGELITIELTDQLILRARATWFRDGDAGLKLARPIDCLAVLRQIVEDHRSGKCRMPRLPLHATAMARVGTQIHTLSLEDISQNGVRVRHSGDFSPGDTVIMRLENGMRLQGIVCWSDGNAAGMRLTSTIPYDRLTSIARLRRECASKDQLRSKGFATTQGRESRLR